MYASSQNLQFWHRRGIKYLKYEAWAEYHEDWFRLQAKKIVSELRQAQIEHDEREKQESKQM